MCDSYTSDGTTTTSEAGSDLLVGRRKAGRRQTEDGEVVGTACPESATSWLVEGRRLDGGHANDEVIGPTCPESAT